MRIVFAGTPEFARRALSALVRAGHTIPLVLTQPDRPAGRGMKLALSPVKREAEALAIPVWQPGGLRDPATRGPIREARPDVMVVAAYGLILPQAVLDIPRLGCLNIHASLLPRWRGAAPIQRAIEAGDKQTGISIMRMEAGLDTGPVLLTSSTPILETDTAGSLHDRLAEAGAQAIVEALDRLDALIPLGQPAEGMTYADKVSKEDAQLKWSHPAEVLARKVRAFNPAPGAWTFLNGEGLKIWRAAPIAANGEPGAVLEAKPEGLIVACGSGALQITELQKAGSRPMSAAAFLAGNPISPSQFLGNA
ncbi:MAG TPA: methionyl-tRNA formyltransferase [Thiobacillaceae bacterium]|nr:methionyl-tRNA formyltransferase [Thiobacillaceae bacterium]